jgi:tetratricopeptide (TPR) repeat protein
MALEGLKRPAEADTAFGESFARLPAASARVRQRVRCGYGFAVCKRLPGKALEAFAEVLRQDPRHPEALYGRAMVAAEQGRAEEAVADLDRALAAAPGLMEARRHRAIQLARCGRFAEAFGAINWCLEREPAVGPTLYAGACVAARAAESSRGAAGGKAITRKALDLLRQALARGYGSEQVATDPDLSGIRDEPEFRRLVAEAQGKRRQVLSGGGNEK